MSFRTKHSRMLSQLTAHSRSAIICYNKIPHSQILTHTHRAPPDWFYLNVHFFDKCHLHSNLIEQFEYEREEKKVRKFSSRAL